MTVTTTEQESELDVSSASVEHDRVEWPATIPLPLQARSHNRAPRSVITTMESGRVRNRPSYTDIFEVMDVRWNLTEDQFDTWKSFVEDDLEGGTKRTMMFGFDSSSIYGVRRMVWRIVAFLPAGTYKFTRSDNLFQVSASLEVITEFHVEGAVTADSELIGNGSPEGVVSAPPGTIYWDKVGHYQWVKEKGICAEGWREQYGGGG